MNDPIPFWWDGIWHVYYQHNPGRPVWGDMHWGHAVSTDLRTWTHLPIALAPDHPYDRDGVWTGCVIEHEGTFYAFYTAIPTLEPFVQVQCLATSQDLIHWTKHPGNPLIEAPPEGYGSCFRDPSVWREGDGWKMVVGSQLEGVGGTLLLYESENLLNWRYVGVANQGRSDETGFDYECPDLFPLEGRWVLITSRHAVHWQVGDFDGRTFTPIHRGVCDGLPFAADSHDASPYYAAKTCVGPDGRRVMFAWLREWRLEEECIASGWSGAQALPRELFIREDGGLGMRPVQELADLGEQDGDDLVFRDVTIEERFPANDPPMTSRPAP